MEKGEMPKIHLSIARHDKQVKTEGVPDEELELTSEGRAHAVAQAELEDISQAVAFGSPRARAQQTAGLAMAGASGGITGDETLAELREKLDHGFPNGKGSKLVIDPRLNFVIDEKTEYGKQATKAFGDGNYLNFLVEQSDELAKQAGDKETTTYSRQAANVASIVEKYMKVAPRWNQLVTDPESRQDQSQEYTNTLERYLRTHGGVGESFLAKVLEHMKGPEERDRFIHNVGGAGFKHSEGFDVNISLSESGEPLVHVRYEKQGETPEESFIFDEDVSAEVIAAIAQGGEIS